MMMTKNIKVYFVLAALFSSFNASSEEIAEKFLVKCYVSLMDGNQTIYFGRLPKQNLQKIAAELEGSKILTVLSNYEKQVYKVHECKLAEKPFANSTARAIESKMER